MPGLNIVGPNIKAARLARKPPVTQQALAARLQVLGWDIDRFGVSKIERGVRRVTDEELLFLVKALGISISLLMPSEED